MNATILPSSYRDGSGACVCLPIRYVVGDGAGEFARAVDVVENNSISIALSFVLEAEGVLRAAYAVSRTEVLAVFAGLFGLPTVSAAEPLVVRNAMKLAASGLDFADALPVAQVSEADTFVTFDKALVKRASRRGGLAVRLA